MDLGNAEEFLSLKGWDFVEADAPTLESFGSATFAYNKDEMSNRAKSFITYLYSDSNSNKRISIQVNNKTKYNEYLKGIKDFGCKLVESNVIEGNIVKMYNGATTTFVITNATAENFFNEETAVWHLLIVSNDDYDLNL